MPRPDSWSDLPIGAIAAPRDRLSLAPTLNCGQAFRWQLRPDGWWHGVISGRAVRLREEEDRVSFQVFPAHDAPGGPSAADEATVPPGSASERGAFVSEQAEGPGDGAGLLRRYLRLDVDLEAIAADLARRDEGIRPALRAFPGLRVLAQDPEETLLSYLCSPANSVPRIAASLDRLSRLHGGLVATLDGYEYHAFPSAAALAAAPAADFRAAGLGWRGECLQPVAGILARDPGWLGGLRHLPYSEAKAALTSLPGVGPKIADCVCLFALRRDEAVPVDTHVWALARELFPTELAAGAIARTLTPLSYERVLRLYQSKYGRWAGWAQQYLYHWRRMGYP